MLGMITSALAVAAALAASSLVAALDAPAHPGVDAPELAPLGGHAVGTTELDWRWKDQLDPLQAKDAPVPFERHLRVRVWYPAGVASAAGQGITYHSSLPGPDTVEVPFDIPGLALSDAKPEPGHFPLVILAHGYSNTPEALAWLAENLASKGYVVAAPAFADPPISQRAKFVSPLARRPLDLALVVVRAQAMSRKGEGPFAGADADHTALIGYSMGGYGVLAAAGAPLSPSLAPLTRGVLGPYVAGGVKAADLVSPDLKAVVAISPASRLGGVDLFGPGAFEALHAPFFFIVGDQDHSVGYDPGVRTVFTQATHAPRYLLTFKEAAHSIALGPVPDEMQARLWDKDWFEDPVWRKERLMSLEEHFITAFLDLYVKGDVSRAGYLDGLIENSDAGTWPEAPPGRYGGYSPGGTVTLWKGFQPGHAAGMKLEFLPGT